MQKCNNSDVKSAECNTSCGKVQNAIIMMVKVQKCNNTDAKSAKMQ
jgi:hypothetical protein